MEQDEFVYEYRMGTETYRFEAHSDHEAQKHRPYAILHFQDQLGPKYSEKSLQGPIRISFYQEMRARA